MAKPTTPIRIDPRIVELCRVKSKDFLRCPRPNAGSFAYFVKVSIYRQLKKMIGNPAYVDELFLEK